MHRWRSASFLLILAVGTSIAETVQNVQKYTTLPQEELQISETTADTGKLDYESALRPAVLQKRSIANIARLLLGGSVPPNHPLVKYPEPKTWNMASNIVAALPGSGLQMAASTNPEGWARQPSSALQNIQSLFETKAKIIPYTGQVATGLTGLASVKGDLIRQIHSISTQAIAQAAAEAAARALASAAAAHAVTNSIAHSVNPGAQTGIKPGWSSYQNNYVEPPGKTPGEQPGPPYQESAHINHYQAPPASFNYPYPVPATTPAPVQPIIASPATYSTQPQHHHHHHHAQQHLQPYQNGYYTLYNTQPPSSQTPYTPAPPVAHARPTLSPNTLIATTPSGYSPSLSKPLLPSALRPLPVIVYAPGSNNTPLTSFRRAVPAGIFGRNAAQPSSTSSLLSTISSLLSASSAAYNAAFTGQPPGGPIQQPSTLFPNLLPSAPSSPFAAPRPTSPATAASSILSSGINSAAHSNGYQQQPTNSVSQGSGYHGGVPSGSGTSYLQHHPAGPYSAPTEARSSSVHAPSYSFNQHGSGHAGANYAQSGANPYAAQPVQSSPQFSSGSAGHAGANAGGVASSGYSQSGPGYSPGAIGSGYPGYNGGPGSSSGHAGRWDSINARPSTSASSWASSPNNYPSGYAGQAPGNANNSPGSYGGSAQFPLASGSSFAQQAYPAPAPNAYQSPAPNNYAQAQPASYPQQSAQLNYPHGYQSATGNPNSIGGFGNSNLAPQQPYSQQPYDLRQSASTMGNDYDSDSDDTDDDIDNDDDTRHHNYQTAQRRNRPQSPSNSYTNSRYPNPAKKRPLKRPPPQKTHHNQNKHSHQYRNNNSNNGQQNRNTNNVVNSSHNSKPKHGNGNSVGGNGKRVVVPGPGPKKGSNLDSAVDVDTASVDDYYQGAGYSSDSDEMRNANNEPDANKNRWRTKNTHSSGQRPNSLYNQHSNGRWKGKEAHAKQAAAKNVRGHGGGPDRTRAQPGQGKGPASSSNGNKKSPPPSHESDKEKRTGQQGKPKTEAAQLYRGRQRPEQQQQPTQYKSRDIYTTLPEYVFRVGERPDVFLRPGGKRKQRVPGRGRAPLHPRLGETDGNGGGGGDGSDVAEEEETLAVATSKHAIYDEVVPRRESFTETEADATRTGDADSDAGAGEEEEFVSAGEAVDEAARTELLSDQVASNSGFLTSEEFDPEEREAFVEDVYADEQSHQAPQRRQDYEDEGTESLEAAVSENEEAEDYLDKK